MIDRILAKPEPPVKMQQCLIIISVDMIHTRKIVVYSHHLNRIMLEFDQDGKRLLKCLKSLGVVVTMIVDNTSQ